MMVRTPEERAWQEENARKMEAEWDGTYKPVAQPIYNAVDPMAPPPTAQSPMASPAPAPVPAKFAQPAAEFLRRPKTPRGGFQ